MWNAEARSEYIGLKLAIVLKNSPAADEVWRLPK
jgi:hypothetical protein